MNYIYRSYALLAENCRSSDIDLYVGHYQDWLRARSRDSDDVVSGRMKLHPGGGARPAQCVPTRIARPPHSQLNE